MLTSQKNQEIENLFRMHLTSASTRNDGTRIGKSVKIIDLQNQNQTTNKLDLHRSTSNLLEDDMKSFIQKRISSISHIMDLGKSEAEMTAIVDRFVKLSEGNFMWMRLTLDEIENGTTEIETILNEEDTPISQRSSLEKISGKYLRLFRKSFPTKDSYRSTTCPVAALFSILIAAKRPPTLSMLRNNLKNVDSAIAAASTIIKENKNGSVHLSHRSVVDWLLTRHSGMYRIDPEQGHALLAASLLRQVFALGTLQITRQDEGDDNDDDDERHDKKYDERYGKGELISEEVKGGRVQLRRLSSYGRQTESELFENIIQWLDSALLAPSSVPPLNDLLPSVIDVGSLHAQLLAGATKLFTNMIYQCASQLCEVNNLGRRRRERTRTRTRTKSNNMTAMSGAAALVAFGDDDEEEHEHFIQEDMSTTTSRVMSRVTCVTILADLMKKCTSISDKSWIDYADADGRTAVFQACCLEGMSVDVLELLLRAGANPYCLVLPVRVTPLHIAARRSNFRLLEMLLKYLDPQHPGGSKSGGQGERCQLLQERRDAQDRKGKTPIMNAASRGQMENVRLLLDWGASAHQLNSQGKNSFIIARDLGKLNIAKMLLERDPTLDTCRVVQVKKKITFEGTLKRRGGGLIKVTMKKIMEMFSSPLPVIPFFCGCLTGGVSTVIVGRFGLFKRRQFWIFLVAASSCLLWLRAGSLWSRRRKPGNKLQNSGEEVEETDKEY